MIAAGAHHDGDGGDEQHAGTGGEVTQMANARGRRMDGGRGLGLTTLRRHEVHGTNATSGTGTVMVCSSSRLTPPISASRNGEW